MSTVTAPVNEATPLPEKVPDKRPSRWVRAMPGYIIAIAGLVWVLHDFQPGSLRGLLTGLDWHLAGLAVVCDILSYVSQGARWKLLLDPLTRISTLRATQAIYAGLFTNEILPMRPGELVRAWMVSRRSSIKLLVVIPSMVVERLFDGLWLVVGVGLTAMFVPLPEDLLRAADILGAIVAIGGAILFFFVLRPPGLHIPSSRPMRIFFSLREKLSSNLQGMARTRGFYLSLAISLVLLMLQATAFWLVMLSAGIGLSLWAGIAVFLIVHLGTAIPNAPANVGSYQFFTVLGLTLFGIDKTRATGFSLFVFVLLTLPLLVLGFIAITTSGTDIGKIRNEMKSLT